LDILIEASAENARRLLDALLDANLGTATLTSVDDILANEITIFRDCVRLDVQSFTPGLRFEDAWRHRVTLTHPGQEFFIASKDDLIASKRGAGRDCPAAEAALVLSQLCTKQISVSNECAPRISKPHFSPPRDSSLVTKSQTR
jgi:hypothetical protein